MIVIKVKTKNPVTYTTWNDQVSRFVKDAENPKERKHPQNIATSGVAEIHIIFNKPLLCGFDATIIYYQNFKTTETFLNTLGVEVSVENPQRIEIINYNKIIDLQKVDLILESIVLTGDDANLKDLSKINAKLPIAIIADIVEKNTLEGLTADQYEYEIIT